MHDQPDGPALLEAARTLLESDVVPLLPEEKQPEARRIAHAMRIAGAHGLDGDEAARAELADLVAVLRAPPPPEGMAGAALERALNDLSWRLAMRIRAGQYDPGRSGHAAAHAHLLATVRRRRRAAGDAVDAGADGA